RDTLDRERRGHRDARDDELLAPAVFDGELMLDQSTARDPAEIDTAFENDCLRRCHFSLQRQTGKQSDCYRENESWHCCSRRMLERSAEEKASALRRTEKLRVTSLLRRHSGLDAGVEPKLRELQAVVVVPPEVTLERIAEQRNADVGDSIRIG